MASALKLLKAVLICKFNLQIASLMGNYETTAEHRFCATEVILHQRAFNMVAQPNHVLLVEEFRRETYPYRLVIGHN